MIANTGPGNRMPTQAQQQKTRKTWGQTQVRGVPTQAGVAPRPTTTPTQTGLAPRTTTAPTSTLGGTSQVSAPISQKKKAPKTIQIDKGGVLPPPATQPSATISPGAASNVLSSPAGTYTLPTQEELRKMFETRYQQELADITTGATERQARERATREQQLANMGIALDSSAYRNEQRALAESAALEAAQARSQARGFAESSVQNEFNRMAQAQQTQLQERQYQESVRQFDTQLRENTRQFNRTYAQQNRKIESDILRDKNLTKLERDKLKETIRSGDLDRALKAQLAAAERAGDANAAQDAADKLALLMDAEFQHNVEILGPERAKEIYEKKYAGGLGGVSYQRISG